MFLISKLWSYLFGGWFRKDTSHFTSYFAEVCIVATQAEARGLANKGNSLIVVKRDIARTVVFQCPCGCKDVIVLNLDSRAGKAWRIFEKDNKVTLTPSVWRTSGCMSHFIVYKNDVWWCNGEDNDLPRGMGKDAAEDWRDLTAYN